MSGPPVPVKIVSGPSALDIQYLMPGPLYQGYLMSGTLYTGDIDVRPSCTCDIRCQVLQHQIHFLSGLPASVIFDGRSSYASDI